MKRFFVEFDFVQVPRDQLPDGEGWLVGGYWDYTKQKHSAVHTTYGDAGTMKTAKGYISRIKKNYPTQQPHNFRIFDRMAPDEPCGHVGEVYFQAV